MTIKQLIKQLEKFDKNSEIMVFNDFTKELESMEVIGDNEGTAVIYTEKID